MSEITDEQKQRAFDSLHNLPFARMIGMRLIEIRPNEAVIQSKYATNFASRPAFYTEALLLR